MPHDHIAVLREALKTLPCVKWSKTRSTVEIPDTEDFAGKALHITGLDKQYARHLAAYIAAANPAAVAAVLTELDVLRAQPAGKPPRIALAASAAPQEQPSDHDIALIWDQSTDEIDVPGLRIQGDLLPLILAHSRALLSRYGAAPQDARNRWPSNWADQLKGEYEQGLKDGTTPQPAAQAVPPVPLIARSLAEWHEDDGPVMWWVWCGHTWAGEPAWCGQPNDSDWPGYHTHWTPRAPFPVALTTQGDSRD